jgi:hypothetical protein
MIPCIGSVRNLSLRFMQRVSLWRRICTAEICEALGPCPQA